MTHYLRILSRPFWPNDASSVTIRSRPKVGWTFRLQRRHLAPPAISVAGQPPHDTPSLTDLAEILNNFDATVVAARALIAHTSDETFAELWTMKMQGQVLFTLPRYPCFRTWITNHSCHHRGILSIYLRMAGVELTPVLA